MRLRLAALGVLAATLALLAIGVTPSFAAPASTGREAPAASPPLRSAATEPSAPAEGEGIEVGPALPKPPPPTKGGEVSTGKASHPGFFDIPGKVEQAINDWFAGLVKDALDPAMVLVGRTLLSTPQIASEAEVSSYWHLALGVADALLVLVVIAAGVIVMHHETLQTSYALKDFIPRLVVAGIATNASLAISGQMVAFANALATGLLGNGVNPQQAGHTLELNPGQARSDAMSAITATPSTRGQANATPASVTVTVTRRVPTILLGIVGLRTLTVSAHATAAPRAP